MHTNYQPQHRDGCGDDGERLRLVATELAEYGWSDDAIKDRVMSDPACVHPAWDDSWVQQEIEACISKVRPLEPKPVAAKAEQKKISGDGVPDWLRARIESLTVPVDRDQYFRETVAALAGRGWDRARITVEIAGRPWVPQRYAGHALEYGVQTLLMLPLRKIDDAAPDGLRPPAAPAAVQSASSTVSRADLPVTPSVTARAAYMEAEDPIAAWIDDRCERDASNWESSAALFASWTAWAEGAGENAGSQRRFAQTLESRGFQQQRMRHGRGFLGLRIIPVDGGATRDACDAS
jgi:hypothetical protein